MVAVQNIVQQLSMVAGLNSIIVVYWVLKEILNGLWNFPSILFLKVWLYLMPFSPKMDAKTCKIVVFLFISQSCVAVAGKQVEEFNIHETFRV